MINQLKDISDTDLGLYFAVINNLAHKSELANSHGPLPFNDTPQAVTRDEQVAILNRLDKEQYISYSIDGKSVWLNERLYVGIPSFSDLWKALHDELHKRQGLKQKQERPYYDPVNRDLHINGLKIKVVKHADNNRQHQLLIHIFINNTQDLSREFDFTEFPFDDVEDKKKFKEICRTACQEINKKIEDQSGGKIKGFLQFNTMTYGFLKINPEYLPG